MLVPVIPKAKSNCISHIFVKDASLYLENVTSRLSSYSKKNKIIGVGIKKDT